MASKDSLTSHWKTGLKTLLLQNTKRLDRSVLKIVGLRSVLKIVGLRALRAMPNDVLTFIRVVWFKPCQAEWGQMYGRF